MFRASKQNEQPSQTQASISRPLHSKNTPVPTLWREQHVPIYLFAILNTQYIIIWIVTNSSEPLSNFFFLDEAAGCIVSSQMSCFTASTKPFLASTSSPVSQERLWSTPSQSVLIFTRLGDRGRCQPCGDFFEVPGGEPACPGLKRKPTDQTCGV